MDEFVEFASSWASRGYEPQHSVPVEIVPEQDDLEASESSHESEASVDGESLDEDVDDVEEVEIQPNADEKPKETDEDRFVKQLKWVGFFTGFDEGTPKYKARVQLAKQQYQKKVAVQKTLEQVSRPVRVEYKERLMGIIPKDKHSSIDELLSKYPGREHRLYMKVCKRYKVESQPEYTISAKKVT